MLYTITVLLLTKKVSNHSLNIKHFSFNFIAAAHAGDDVGDVDVDVMQLEAEQHRLERKHVWCFHVHILPCTVLYTITVLLLTKKVSNHSLNLKHFSFNFIAAAHAGDDVGDVDVDVMQLEAEQHRLERMRAWFLILCCLCSHDCIDVADDNSK